MGMETPHFESSQVAEMHFQLAHVGFVTAKQAQAMDFYCSGLGMLPLALPEGFGADGDTFLTNAIRGGLLLEVRGPTRLSEDGLSNAEVEGSRLDHIHFWVPNVCAAYDYLRGMGCPSRREPMAARGVLEAAVYDPQGVEIWLQDLGREELVRAIAAARREAEKPDARFQAELHHVGILTPDRQTAVDFYTRVMGMQIRSRFYLPGSIDVTYLTDSIGGGGYLQIEGPPHLPYEESYLAAHGPGLNHLHFTVEDMGPVYSRLLALGAVENIRPHQVEDMQHTHLVDPMGIDLQLLRFPPNHLLR